MKTVWQHRIRPFLTVVRRRPKVERRAVKPLFWLIPHVGRQTYLEIYVPGRVAVVGFGVFSQVKRYIVGPNL